MIENMYFAEELENISSVYIPTSFGEVHALTAGKIGQPLILVVHGSGPRNSSDQYRFLLHEYLVRISYLEKFYIVAIDCPGYGKSKGSMITIKTFPLQLFKEILGELGYKTYFAMFGHSQGGAAIFNSVYDDPSITQYLLMDRPVCGNIKRFHRFPLPTLLVYDIEDDGHPIWQGKLLYKELLKSQFHTYRNSQDPYWVPDNIWDTILCFLEKYRHTNQQNNPRKNVHTRNNENRLQHRSLSRQKVSEESRQLYTSAIKRRRKGKAQSLDKKFEKKTEKVLEESLGEIKQVEKSQIFSIMDKSEILSKMSELEEYEELPPSFNQAKIQITAEQIKKQEEWMQKKKQELIRIRKQSKQFEEEVMIEEKKQVKSSKPKQKESQEQQLDNKCPICYDYPYYPLQTNCKHIFCSKCLREALLVDERCPMCRTKVTRKQSRVDLHHLYIQKLSKQEKDKKQNQLNKFENMLKSIVYIEIGNHSRQIQTKNSAFSRTKKKYMWEIFAKQPKNFKFDEVQFNINMGNRDSKPIRVTSSPFTFESRGTFSFSCQIIIKPRNRDYDTITSVYRIDVAPGTHTKTIALRKKR